MPEPTGATLPPSIRHDLDLCFLSRKLLDSSLLSRGSPGNCVKGSSSGRPASAGEPPQSTKFSSPPLSFSLALVVVRAGVENPPILSLWCFPQEEAGSAPFCSVFLFPFFSFLVLGYLLIYLKSLIQSRNLLF